MTKYKNIKKQPKKQRVIIILDTVSSRVYPVFVITKMYMYQAACSYIVLYFVIHCSQA
jgi:hypothetical protein